MPAKAMTFDDCLARAGEKRPTLETLRAQIHVAAPGVEEYVGYGLAAFRLNGRPLVAIGTTATKCAFYLMSSSMVATHAEALKAYDTSTGTIRYPADKPLPVTLVRKLVKARIAENERIASAKKPKAKTTQSDPEVVQFLADLDHPLKKEIEAVRQIILGASPMIAEGIKWKVPSFRATEYFATLNLKSRDRVQLIFHFGAKKRADLDDVKIPDPSGLIEWLANDRAMVTVGAGNEIAARKGALVKIVRAWIGWV